MFFIGIFGVENKKKEVKDLNNIYCKNCDKSLDGRLIKTFNFFHFFFIPLFKWNEKYYVVCNDCGSIYEIPKDKGKKAEKGKDVEITYWDLGHCHSIENRCTHCGKVIGHDFKYCPYCGERI